jgi:hypothetical protein
MLYNSIHEHIIESLYFNSFFINIKFVMDKYLLLVHVKDFNNYKLICSVSML